MRYRIETRKARWSAWPLIESLASNSEKHPIFRLSQVTSITSDPSIWCDLSLVKVNWHRESNPSAACSIHSPAGRGDPTWLLSIQSAFIFMRGTSGQMRWPACQGTFFSVGSEEGSGAGASETRRETGSSQLPPTQCPSSSESQLRMGAVWIQEGNCEWCSIWYEFITGCWLGWGKARGGGAEYLMYPDTTQQFAPKSLLPI